MIALTSSAAEVSGAYQTTCMFANIEAGLYTHVIGLVNYRDG